MNTALVFADSAELQKAKALKDAGKREEAAKILEDAVNTNPQDAEAHRLLGWVYVGMGEGEKARVEFQAYLRSMPNGEKAEEVRAALERLGKGSSERGKATSSVSMKYHAYFRKVALEDPGTVHLFISNTTGQSLKIERIHLNGYEMTDMPNDLVIWYQAVPAIAQPGEVLDVMVKLRRPTRKLVRIAVSLNNGEEVWAVVESTPPDLKFSFIAFSKDRDRVYLYLENTGKEHLEIKKLLSNTEDITRRCEIPERIMAPFSKALIIFTPEAPLQPGRYLVFKALTHKGIAAATVSRVYSHFPITAFGGDTRESLGFDRDPFELRYPGKSEEFNDIANQSLHKAYHLLDDPACVDVGARELLGNSASEIISRGRRCWESDSVHPSVIYACEAGKPYCYLVYGETSDLLAVDPYEMYFYQRQPLENARFVALAKKACEPRLLWTIPEAFTHPEPRRIRIPDENRVLISRFPTPEEERIIVYSEIGEGSKGIWYFIYNKSEGYGASPPLEAEIGRINRELQVLREYILVGEPFPLVKANAEKVKTYSLLCGDKAIVLVLVNGDHQSFFEEGKPPFVHTPQKHFEVRCQVPHWLKVTDVSAIRSGEKSPVKHEIRGDELLIPVEELDVTQQLLILTERAT